MRPPNGGLERGVLRLLPALSWWPDAWSEGVLFDADRAFLDHPVERQGDVRSQFQIGQFSTLGDRLDDFRREKRQPYQARDVAIRAT